MIISLHLTPDDGRLADPELLWAHAQLACRAQDDLVAPGSLETLAREWHRSKSTVHRLLTALAAGGWITLTPARGRHPLTIRLTGHGLTRESPAAGDAASPPEAADRRHESANPGERVAEPPPARTASRRPVPDPHGAAARRLVQRHAAQYTARFGQPFPVAWARDMTIMKRLVALYGEDQVAVLQDRYLAQPLDSFAGQRGYPIPQFASEAASLAAQAQLTEALTPYQALCREALEAAGVPPVTALALVTAVDVQDLREQIRAHRWRRAHGKPATARILERAIRERWPVPPAAQTPDEEWRWTLPRDDAHELAVWRQEFGLAADAPAPELPTPAVPLTAEAVLGDHPEALAVFREWLATHTRKAVPGLLPDPEEAAR